ICDDFAREEASDFTMRHFWDCLTHAECTVNAAVPDALADNPAVDCKGTLWGGNLSMLTHLLGTPSLAVTEEGVACAARRIGRLSRTASCSSKTSMNILTGSNACSCNCCMAACWDGNRRWC